MASFLISIGVLVAGYLFYGRFVSRAFGPTDRETPAVAMKDGVDYIPMPTWKVFLIQLLNIAGTGPIFGALSGALFGPIVYIWIIFGNILGGAVHDYMCGMLSVRHNGANISEITGNYLGNGMRQVMRVFSVILLVMCGVVFTTGPADLLALLTPESLNSSFWLWIIIAYYFIATFVPIDKLIGRLYPLFGICLIVMALGVSGSLVFSGNYEMPELWNAFTNLHPEGTPVWPFMLITVACGAISGFHATQSPMMARCLKSEKQGRRVFYGAMVAEGIIALVWAAAGVSCYESSSALLEAGGGCSNVVYEICTSTMGKVGGIIAIIGVIVCPISSGDTAYRSARLTLADWFKIDQKCWWKRILLTLPLLVAGALICHIDYSVVWRYFSFSNQALAAIGLWAFSVYMARARKKYLITALPAAFMTAVTGAYFLSAPECLGALWNAIGIGSAVYYPVAAAVGAVAAVVLLAVFIRYSGKAKALE